ncbi:restriction endonuclease subunit S [Enterococcus faecium]|uniref:restriction endonuclease subunit S n=1 Tax=Enterococcus faecium TaxID=1352 RepID=UPI00032F1B73|nr:restriction endonuclease subunit S [Enterococcus faecium]EGP5022123.1 restriction endonuclease subunit S [Enterococcus faecium]EOG11141.1 hypothetical protein SKY_00304 [Enterococcus faecium EnGen0175]MBX9090643.1 restriction endonuclease subunit S [Enterococcus faecium]MBX9107353.1 restriction endonuclease subunit S [Enterococcus faecium]MDT2353146.1 restriction endonuclease subunit S [Enterococcus faecium]
MINTKALREKILDLAMRGKLVPQDPTDEPASVLLDKIKEEKEQLIKDKKIKKEKPLPKISKEEIPYEIPDSWEWVSIRDISTITMGQAPKSSNVNNEGNGFEFHQGKTLFSSMYVEQSGVYTTSPNKVINPPAIIMSVRAPVGDVNLIDRKIVIGRGLAAFVPGDGIELLFLYNYLQTQKSYLLSLSTGTTFKAINSQTVRTINVPLPPLKEQKRIVAKLEELFALIDTIESNQLEFKQLAEQLDKKVLDLAMRGKLVPQDPTDEPASVLLDKIKEEKEQLIKDKKIKKEKALPEISKEEIPYEIPDSWEWVRLVDIGSIFSGGTPKTTINEFWEKGTIPWITPAIMGKSKSKIFNSVALKHITEQGLNASSAQLIPGSSIVYSSRAPIGHINIVPYPYSTNQGCKSVTPIKVDVDYLYYCLVFRTPDIKKRASGTTFKEISGKGFSMTVVSIPPLAEQKRIVAKIEMIRESIQRIDFE